MTTQYQGACLCNQVAYQAAGEYDRFFCVIENMVKKTPAVLMPLISLVPMPN